MLTGISLFAVLLVVVVGIFFVRRQREKSFIAAHTITPEALHNLLEQGHDIMLLDVRLSLDLLAYSEIIPGATRMAPEAIQQMEAILSRDKDTVFYCTCSGQESSYKALTRALALGFARVRLLLGGLEGWKMQGYRVEPYTTVFHLDTQR